jgi:hypothetical protein
LAVLASRTSYIYDLLPLKVSTLVVMWCRRWESLTTFAIGGSSFTARKSWVVCYLQAWYVTAKLRGHVGQDLITIRDHIPNFPLVPHRDCHRFNCFITSAPFLCPSSASNFHARHCIFHKTHCSHSFVLNFLIHPPHSGWLAALDVAAHQRLLLPSLGRRPRHRLTVMQPAATM